MKRNHSYNLRPRKKAKKDKNTNKNTNTNTNTRHENKQEHIIEEKKVATLEPILSSYKTCCVCFEKCAYILSLCGKQHWVCIECICGATRPNVDHLVAVNEYHPLLGHPLELKRRRQLKVKTCLRGCPICRYNDCVWNPCQNFFGGFYHSEKTRAPYTCIWCKKEFLAENEDHDMQVWDHIQTCVNRSIPCGFQDCESQVELYNCQGEPFKHIKHAFRHHVRYHCEHIYRGQMLKNQMPSLFLNVKRHIVYLFQVTRSEQEQGDEKYNNELHDMVKCVNMHKIAKLIDCTFDKVLDILSCENIYQDIENENIFQQQ